MNLFGLICIFAYSSFAYYFKEARVALTLASFKVFPADPVPVWPEMSSSQTVSVVNVTNTANSGGYTATVKAMNISLSTTISNAATVDRNLNVYKDSTNTTALGTTTYLDTTMAVAGDSYTNTNFLNGDITDVEISSGSTKTFYFTLDTTDATTNNTLSVTIPAYHSSKYGATASDGAYGLVWSDGLTTTIVASDNILPLIYKTLSY